MRVGLLANIRPEEAPKLGTSAVALPSPSHGSQYAPSELSDLYAEWDSLETVEAVRDALRSHPEVSVEIIEAVPEIALPKLQEHNFDIIFNIAEGFLGSAREAQFPAIMEMMGIPYTGSGPLTLAIAL